MPKTTPNSCMFEDVLVFIHILQIIPLNRWITISEITTQIEAMGYPIHLRTLQRIMKMIREHSDTFPIRVNTATKPYGFQWDGSGRGFHLPLLGPRESLLLRLADEYLHFQLPASALTGLRPLFRDARMSFDARPEARTSSWLRKIKVVSPSMPFLPPQIKPTVFEAVTQALLEDRMLAVQYRNVRDRLVEARVMPLGLVQQDVRTYLVCQFEKYTDYRHLALHRIENARIEEEPFERPKTFDLDAYVNAAPFNYAQGRTIRLEILTDDPALVKNLTETPFNRSQRIAPAQIDEDTPGWTLTVELEDSLLLDGWLAMRRCSILSTKKTIVSETIPLPTKSSEALAAQIEAAQIASEAPATLAAHPELGGAVHDDLLVMNRRLVERARPAAAPETGAEAPVAEAKPESN